MEKHTQDELHLKGSDKALALSAKLSQLQLLLQIVFNTHWSCGY